MLTYTKSRESHPLYVVIATEVYIVIASYEERSKQKRSPSLWDCFTSFAMT